MFFHRRRSSPQDGCLLAYTSVCTSAAALQMPFVVCLTCAPGGFQEGMGSSGLSQGRRGAALGHEARLGVVAGVSISGVQLAAVGFDRMHARGVADSEILPMRTRAKPAGREVAGRPHRSAAAELPLNSARRGSPRRPLSARRPVRRRAGLTRSSTCGWPDPSLSKVRPASPGNTRATRRSPAEAVELAFLPLARDPRARRRRGAGEQFIKVAYFVSLEIAGTK